VAKVVKKQDIADLKALIKTMASSEEEYNRLLTEELQRISDMHDSANPVPGIIYQKDKIKLQKLLCVLTKKFCKEIKSHKFTKNEMAFLLTAMISELGLTQEDFLDLKKSLEEGEDIGDEPPEF
jgi:hypothetical protein